MATQKRPIKHLTISILTMPTDQDFVWSVKEGRPGESARIVRLTAEERATIIRVGKGLEAQQTEEQVRNEWVAS